MKNWSVLAALLAIGVVPFLSAQLEVIPVAQDVAAVKASTMLHIPSRDVERSVERIAKIMGARLGRSPRGSTVVVLRVPAIKLDDNCVYPIIDAKTGRRMSRFSELQRWAGSRHSSFDAFTGLLKDSTTRSAAIELNGDVLLELSIEPVEGERTRLEFSSNCLADTQLGRKLAYSTGKFEREFFLQLAPGLNLDVWTTAASATVDAPAVLEYKARSEFDANDVHRDVLRHLHPGVSDRTLVKAETIAKPADVWRAAQRATGRFSDLRGLAVTRTDERFHQIQNGDASVGGRGDRPWREDLTTTISDTGDGRTRIMVIRRLLVPSSDGLAWRGYPSDGEMESWLIGAILGELPTGLGESSEKRAVEQPSVPPRPVLVPPAPVPAPLPTTDADPSSSTTEVAITSSVENSDVYVDGHFVGNAPLPNYRLPAGAHTIEVRAAGYETWSREITIAANAATRVSAQLRRQP